VEGKNKGTDAGYHLKTQQLFQIPTIMESARQLLSKAHLQKWSTLMKDDSTTD
jgi:hypothetical protein